MAASPDLELARPRTSAAAQWLGPAVELGDATISGGLIWVVGLIGALWAGAVTFGIALTAVAMLGAWQAAGVRSRAGATRPSSSATEARPQIAESLVLPQSHRLPAAALAGAVGFAGVLDTRLAGVVVGGAVAASFIVVAALRPRRPDTGAAMGEQASPLRYLSGAGLLIRTWMQVGVAAACLAAIARYSLGAALVLVSAAAAHDASAHLSASGRQPGLRGPLMGAIAAVIAVFALTGLSVPPFAPNDVFRFGVLAASTLPLGPALARPNTALAARREHVRAGPPNANRRSVAGSGASEPAGGLQRARERLAGEWAVRRLDSLSVTALAWLWGLGLLAI
ncbi:hypothetical protein [Candidatus Poriferisodalis sp.]|uniref:hypothetical protein n=1 Tax=Candidatus Poriferisodalis sp. TaxID=3101277 RepID=UPI003B013136